MSTSRSPARTEIVFVFDDLPDWQQLAAGVREGAQVVVLDGAQDGLAQIAAHLQGRSGIDAIHIVSHSQSGQVALGSTSMSQATLGQQAQTLAEIGASLSADGDILIYGCNVGAGEAGGQFVTQLATLTQADVAASSNFTGHASLLADWNLEVTHGDVAHETPFTDIALANYQHVLPTTLVAGDIAVIGFNADDDDTGTDLDGDGRADIRWAIMAMRDIDPGTVIHFTDAGIKEDGSFFVNPANEGHLTWTVMDRVSAGKILAMDTANGTNVNDLNGAELGKGGLSDYGTVSGGMGGTPAAANTFMASAGDQIIVYQGTAGTTAGATFIYALNTSQNGFVSAVGGWQTNNIVTAQQQSYIPVGLTNGSTALALTTNISGTSSGTGSVGSPNYGFDNMVYQGTLTGTRAQLLAEIGNPSNWAGDDTVPFPIGTGSGFSYATNFTVVAPPTLVSATFADDNLKIGDTSDVTFTFSTAVYGFTSADLTVPNGSIPTLISVDGGTTWTGTFTPTVGVTDATNVITVAMTGVTSVSGSLAGNGTATSSNYAIDTQAPAVALVTSPSPNGTYIAGSTVLIAVMFDGNVTVTGTPQLTLETGAVDQVADYDGGPTLQTVFFSYTVAPGDYSPDLDYVSTSALALNGGTIRDSAGNDAILTLPAPGTGNSLGANKAIVINSAPAIGNLNGDSVAWPGVGNSVTLDASGNATVADTEYDAANWSGAFLTVQRANTSWDADVFSFNTAGYTVNGNDLQTGGAVTFGTFTNTNGVLTISFNANSTNTLVRDVLRGIQYRNDTPAGDATLRFALSDGSASTTADVTVTSDVIYVTNATDTATVNVTDGVSFSEAVAIAAADATGSQSLVFDPAVSGPMTLAGNLSINESLSVTANAVNLSGSTITLGGGTTLGFTNTSGTSTISSTLAGTGALAKNGAGTLMLTSTGNEANMSGGITVNAGALQISSDDQLSSGMLTLNGGMLTSSAAFTIDNAVAIGALGGSFHIGGGGATAVALSGIISGSGTLAKTGASILQLYGNNTFSGAMNIGAGTVEANHANAFGTTAGSTTVAAGATVRVAGGLTIAESFSVAGPGTTVSGTEYGALHLVSGSSTLSGNVNMISPRIGADSGATLTLSGVLSGGAGNLEKIGAGTLVLSNTGNEAASASDTTVTAGTLQISNDDQLSSGTLRLNGGTLAITGATTIDNTVVLAFASTSTINTSANATLSGALSGVATLTKTGASTLTLAGSSSGHGGAVNVSAGGLTLSGGSALGDTSALTLAAGTTLTVAGTETIGSLAGAGSTTLNAALAAGGDNTSTTYSGVLSGSFGLAKTGTGTLTLTGGNTYSGDTNVTAGTLALNQVGGTLSDTTAVTVASGATLALGASDTVGQLSGAGTVALGGYELAVGATGQSSTFSGSVTGSGSLVLNGGYFTLSGTNSGQSWGTQVRGGSVLAIAADANLGTGTVQLNNGALAVTGNAMVDNAIDLQGIGGSVQVGAGLAVTLSGVVSGGSVLHKLGSGTLVLSGSNTYTGATNITEGSLLVQGALAGTTGIEVLSGARLGGDGTLFATGSAHTVDVQSGATLAAGGSAGAAGALTINGDLQLAGASTLEAQINGAASGTGYDTVVLNGSVNLNGATLAATLSGGYTPVNGAVYTLINNDGADAITGTFAGIVEGAIITVSGVQMRVNYGGGDGNDLTLTALMNSAPTVANPIPNQNATEDATFSFSIAGNTFADADAGDLLTYSAQLAGGGTLPSWLTFDPAMGTFSGTPTNGDVGTISIEVTADDSNGGTVTDTFDIVVANTNDAPTVANPIANQGATEDAAFTFQFAANTFHDVDVGDTLTYSAGLAGGGVLPSWLSFDGGTRTFSGTPTNGDVGTLTITVTAADGDHATATDTFTLTVANTNDAPTVANPIADRSATASMAFSYVLPANTFHDVDVGDTLTYSAQLAGGGALPSWLTFNSATGTFSGVPGSADVGTLSIEVTATDAQNATVSDSFDIVVGAAPVIPTPQPEPEPEPPVTPPVTPGVPDNDGIPAEVEDQTPGIPGPNGTTVTGDGNGDGIKDSEQSGVASVGFILSPTAESAPGDAPPTFTTLVASSLDGKVSGDPSNSRITSLSQKDAPEHLPEGMEMPIGLISFTVELGAGKTGEDFSLYVDPALGANGYWKQDANGIWVNLASEPYGGKMVMEGGRVRLDFHIEDGGQFDADGKADGIITDPGAPAYIALSLTGLAPDLPQGFWF